MATPLRVLLVEDSGDDAQLITRELARAGYVPRTERVDTARDLRAALGRGPWDVVVSDFRMPAFSGTDALKLLRDRDPDTPFIFVSGTIGEDLAAEAMRAGAQDYVTKANLRRLVPAIERELRDAAVRRERRTAQDALHVSEARYRQLVDNAPYGIYRVTVGGRFETVNPALVRMLGYESPDELLGLDVAHELFADADERTRLIDRVLAGERTAPEVEWKRKDGRPITVRLGIHPQRAADGSVAAFEVVAEDVTEQRRLEDQLRQAQKMEAIGRLAGGVAHDFNNILTVIINYAALVLEDLPPEQQSRADLLEIRRAAESAAALTRQLLAFSRQQVLEPRVLNLNENLTVVEKMLRRLIGEHIQLVTHFAPGLGHIRADPGQFEQVVMNLVVNARDAMPQGGRLTIETANAELDETSADAQGPVVPGRYVLLAVSDTGSGMDEATRSQIFEPFFTTKGAGTGTGLGLSTVYGVVKQSGGYVWVYSEPGRGSTFKVYLPRVNEPAESLPAHAHAPPRGGTETILLVEDFAGLRVATRKLLERWGYTVLEAADAEAALDLCTHHRDAIALVVTDVVLPSLSGPELVQHLRSMHPAMRVLYLSGYADLAVVRHGILEPGTPFLQKPFTGAVLARKVREVLDTA